MLRVLLNCHAILNMIAFNKLLSKLYRIGYLWEVKLLIIHNFKLRGIISLTQPRQTVIVKTGNRGGLYETVHKLQGPNRNVSEKWRAVFVWVWLGWVGYRIGPRGGVLSFSQVSARAAGLTGHRSNPWVPPLRPMPCRAEQLRFHSPFYFWAQPPGPNMYVAVTNH